MTKYRNQPTMFYGIKFDSKREGERYLTLRGLQEEGKISDLRLQVKMPIEINGVKVCDYIPDFMYLLNGEQVVEDAKGVKTAVYQLKKKLVRACYGITIKES